MTALNTQRISSPLTYFRDCLVHSYRLSLSLSLSLSHARARAHTHTHTEELTTVSKIWEQDQSESAFIGFHSPNRTIRHNWEQGMQQEFCLLGYNSVQSSES
jgi:hypothetical protein